MFRRTSEMGKIKHLFTFKLDTYVMPQSKINIKFNLIFSRMFLGTKASMGMNKRIDLQFKALSLNLEPQLFFNVVYCMYKLKLAMKMK